MNCLSLKMASIIVVVAVRSVKKMYSILLDAFKVAVLFFPFGFILIGVGLIYTGLHQKKEREEND